MPAPRARTVRTPNNPDAILGIVKLKIRTATLLKKPLADRYYARIAVVLDFIDNHLEEDLTVEKLSEVAGFSRFHFHSQFSALTGISLSKYVRLRRLKRAAYSLAYRDDNLTEIALDTGYESLEAFIRAFKRNLGKTPLEFRNHREPGRTGGLSRLLQTN